VIRHEADGSRMRGGKHTHGADSRGRMEDSAKSQSLSDSSGGRLPDLSPQTAHQIRPTGLHGAQYRPDRRDLDLSKIEITFG
jgi:hypothetical protein